MKFHRTLYLLIVIATTCALWISYMPGPEVSQPDEALRRTATRIQAAKPVELMAARPKQVVTEREKNSISAGDEYLKAHQDEIRIQPFHKPVGSVIKTPMGDKVTYTFSQDGMPIVGLWLSIQFDNNYNVIQFENQYRPVKQAEIHEPRNPEAVVETFRSPLPMKLTEIPAEMNSILYVSSSSDTPEQSYVYTAVNKLDARKTVHVVVRQNDGQILGLTTIRF